MPFLIDGYNLLRSVQKQREQTLFAEAELCMVLREYLRRRRHRGTIIFDGIGPRNKERLQGVGSLQIVFSGHGVEADAVMERLIFENTAPKRLTVVSSDRRLRKAAATRRATAVKSEEFWQKVREELQRKKPQRKEPQAKKEGLTEGETEQWMDLFGIEE